MINTVTTTLITLGIIVSLRHSTYQGTFRQRPLPQTDHHNLMGPLLIPIVQIHYTTTHHLHQWMGIYRRHQTMEVQIYWPKPPLHRLTMESHHHLLHLRRWKLIILTREIQVGQHLFHNGHEVPSNRPCGSRKFLVTMLLAKPPKCPYWYQDTTQPFSFLILRIWHSSTRHILVNA